MPISAYERVKIARGGKRPTGADFIDHLFTGFFELHGDRRFADDAAIIGGVAYLDTLPVTVIAIEKGHTARERLQRSFGAPNPKAYRKLPERAGARLPSKSPLEYDPAFP